MTVLAVKSYVATLGGTVSLAGLPWPRMAVYTEFPRHDPDGFQCTLVMGEYSDVERRLAGARGMGTKKVDYQLVVMLIATSDDADLGGRAFDTLVERVKAVYRSTVPGQLTLTDPDTGETSKLYSIGEIIQRRVLTPDTGDDVAATTITFRGVLTLELSETIQPA